jgi:hypothetical protein
MVVQFTNGDGDSMSDRDALFARVTLDRRVADIKQANSERAGEVVGN